MSEGGYRIADQNAVHFITFSVGRMDRRLYKINIMRYCSG